MKKQMIVVASGLFVALAALAAAPPAAAQTPIDASKVAKLEFDIQAPDLAGARSYQYAVYVDNGARQVLTATCGNFATPTANTFTCSAPLPALTQGVHALELTAADVGTGTPIESARSLPLSIRVVVAPAVPQTLRITF